MSEQVKRRRGGPSVFGELDDAPSASQVSDEIFGSSKTSRHLRAKPIPINQIRPDPLQPRRAVPTDLRATWQGDPLRIQLMFDDWLAKIREERDGRELIWKNILTGSDSLRGNEAENLEDAATLNEALLDLSPAQGKLERSFLRLVDLAASIKRDGLTNPITIASTGKKSYIIETGERRWLAYHLLNMVYGGDEWTDIPARQVTEVSVWRQASENNARADLNAVAKARQLALLLMALLDWDNFQPIEQFSHEREFYAQVADGNRLRVPRGYGEQLVNAMGLSSASHLRRYRAILKIDSDLWDAADDGDWTEREIRDKWQTRKQANAKAAQAPSAPPIQRAHPSDELLATRNYFSRQVRDIAKSVHKSAIGEVSNQERLDTLTKINAMRDWLDEQEQLINTK